MNFATLQGLTIPEGVVTQITDASGRVIWNKVSFVPIAELGTPSFTYSSFMKYYSAMVDTNIQEAVALGVNTMILDGVIIPLPIVKNPSSGYIIWTNYDGSGYPASAGQYQVNYRNYQSRTIRFTVYSFTDISGCEIVLGKM